MNKETHLCPNCQHPLDVQEQVMLKHMLIIMTCWHEGCRMKGYTFAFVNYQEYLDGWAAGKYNHYNPLNLQADTE